MANSQTTQAFNTDIAEPSADEGAKILVFMEQRVGASMTPEEAKRVWAVMSTSGRKLAARVYYLVNHT